MPQNMVREARFLCGRTILKSSAPLPPALEGAQGGAPRISILFVFYPICFLCFGFWWMLLGGFVLALCLHGGWFWVDVDGGFG